MPVYDDQDTKKSSHDKDLTRDAPNASTTPGGGHDNLGSSPDDRATEVDELNRLYDQPDIQEPSYNDSNEENDLNNKQALSETDDGLFKDKGGKGKKRLSGMAGMAGAAYAVPILFTIVLLFMSLSGIRLENLSQIVMSYRFASFQRQLSNRIDHIILSDSVYADGSPELDKYSKTKLGAKRLGRFSPELALRTLGEGDIEIKTRQRTITRGVYIESITDKRTGRTINLNSSADLAAARNLINNRVKTDGSVGRLLRSQVVNWTFDNSGIRLAKWRSFLADPDKSYTADEARALRGEEDLETSRGDGDNRLTTNIDALDEAADNAEADILEGKNPRTTNSLSPATIQRLQNLAKFSDYTFYATTACIVRDIAIQSDELINGRIDNPKILAADLLTKADQVNSGDTVAAAISAEAEKWDGAEQSSRIKRAMGLDESLISPTDDLSPEYNPFTVFGVPLDTVGESVGYVEDFFSVADFATFGQLDDICSVLLDPTGQAVLATVDLATLILTFGGDKAVSRGLRTALEAFVSTSRGFALSYIVYNKIVPTYIEELAGAGAVAFAGEGVQNGNRIDLGAMLWSNDISYAFGANDLNTAVAYDQQSVAVSKYRESWQEFGAFSENNPLSIQNQMFASISGMSSFQGLISNVFGSFSGLIPISGAQTNTDYEFHGLSQVAGWTDESINGETEGFNHVENTIYVEDNLSSLKSQFGKCPSYNTASRFTGDFDVACNSIEAQRFKMYFTDCLLTDIVSKSTSKEDAFTSSECLEDVEGIRI